MNNRSAAREIIMLAIPQLPKDVEKFNLIDFNKIILSTTRSLSDYAKKSITTVSSNLQKMEKFIINVEVEHPDNEEHTSQLKSVLIPETEVLKDQIESLKASCTELYNALELPELIVHMGQEATLTYAKNLFQLYIENKEQVNEVIEQAALSRKKDKKWKVDRMVRLDRDILRIATVELLFLEETPTEVICDEAVKIAEKYGGNESKNFVNGVLGDIVNLARKEVSV